MFEFAREWAELKNEIFRATLKSLDRMNKSNVKKLELNERLPAELAKTFAVKTTIV